MNAKITPIVLCGGSGTRLWPLSRRSYPKQFAKLTEEESLFQATVRRVQGGDSAINFEPPVVVTNADFRFIVTEQMQSVGVEPGPIMIEPAARNTGPAVLVAAQFLWAQDPDAIMLVVPSDHLIPDTEAFHAALGRGIEAVAAGKLVLFGIQPDRAETGYGYLELENPAGPDAPAVTLRSFVEKPDKKRAEQMLASGAFLWNAGIFLFRAKDIIAAFQKHAPTLMAPVTDALAGAQNDLGFLRLDPAAWDLAPDISLDYAVMEKASDLAVVCYGADWSDLGGWDAIWRVSNQDTDGNAVSVGATAIDCQNSLLRSESQSVELVGIGLTDIIAVAMNDAVLVATKDRAQDVKLAVEALKAKAVTQAETFPKDHRPWGWFESLVVGPRFQVKRIVVHPGASLSLQSHFHRSEHWIVVEGTAEVTVDDTVRLVTENESIYVPLGSVHRMVNPGKVPMVLIEVQTGSYVGEDDIVRYEDVYARGQGAKG
ncbi:mannose-1-phosphate guanylyltransferase/mannose-6-phosphate isomerase [Sulfitobacter sp. SK012]|uniref:mannose-1-phosphate guanylyltransferase/mannose-6-phosphate isomerase n=1 Tax=Sulfitobacter sp. SK012 TaxID=1389005 RepID=UPI000E0BDC21|nr:mannose-1-phosphate guanylyltransferase/mannose-6-phosphate isomerase [Sulfitobacter sp. SK012]AXI46700.1 mannose-1-phosphate guanylyltransferase/mannose-6-phosphate isomerase [Sulfitobacter sp. SK012]